MSACDGTGATFGCFGCTNCHDSPGYGYDRPTREPTPEQRAVSDRITADLEAAHTRYLATIPPW